MLHLYIPDMSRSKEAATKVWYPETFGQVYWMYGYTVIQGGSGDSTYLLPLQPQVIRFEEHDSGCNVGLQPVFEPSELTEFAQASDPLLRWSDGKLIFADHFRTEDARRSGHIVTTMKPLQVSRLYQ